VEEVDHFIDVQGLHIKNPIYSIQRVKKRCNENKLFVNDFSALTPSSKVKCDTGRNVSNKCPYRRNIHVLEIPKFRLLLQLNIQLDNLLLVLTAAVSWGLGRFFSFLILYKVRSTPWT
jgi:hypothetical protein